MVINQSTSCLRIHTNVEISIYESLCNNSNYNAETSFKNDVEFSDSDNGDKYEQLCDLYWQNQKKPIIKPNFSSLMCFVTLLYFF